MLRENSSVVSDFLHYFNKDNEYMIVGIGHKKNYFRVYKNIGS